MEESSGYWRGLVTGVIVGAAAALLLTPKKGDELRHELADGASKLKDKAGTLGEKAGELKERGVEALHNLRGDAEDALAGTLEDAGEIAGEMNESESA